MRENHNLKVLFVSVEVAPFAKTGGIGRCSGFFAKGFGFHGI